MGARPPTLKDLTCPVRQPLSFGEGSPDTSYSKSSPKSTEASAKFSIPKASSNNLKIPCTLGIPWAYLKKNLGSTRKSFLFLHFILLDLCSPFALLVYEATAALHTSGSCDSVESEGFFQTQAAGPACFSLPPPPAISTSPFPQGPSAWVPSPHINPSP